MQMPLLKKLELKYENLKAQFPKGQASGEDITINDSSNLEFDKFKVLGNSYQETSEASENILDLSVIQDETKNDIILKKQTNNTLSLNGTSTEQTIFTSRLKKNIINSNNNYVLQIGKISGTISTGTILIYLQTDDNKASGTPMLNANSNKGEVSLNITDEYSKIVITISNGAILDNVIIYLQVVPIGTKEYIQFSPTMPSLNYPSEIESCGDNVNLLNYKNIIGDTLAVNDMDYIYSKQQTQDTRPWNYEKCDWIEKLEKGTVATPYSKYNEGNINFTISNKNLADSSKTISYYDNNTDNIEFIENGYILKYSSSLGRTSRISKMPCKIQKGHSYYINFNSRYLSGTEQNVNCYFPEIDQYLSRDAIIEAKEDVNYLGIYVGDIAEKDRIEITNVVVYELFDSETSSSNIDKTYVAHEGQNISIPVQKPFRAIGDIRDTFIFDKNKWYEKHIIGRYVLTGDEFYGTATSPNRYHIQISLNPQIPTPDYTYNMNILSNMFIKTANYSSDVEGGKFGHFTLSTNFLIFPDNQNEYTLITFKAKIKELYDLGTPVYIDYILAEPKLIECNEEQTKILDKLQRILSYEDITNIICTDETECNFKVTAKISKIKELKEQINAQIGV